MMEEDDIVSILNQEYACFYLHVTQKIFLSVLRAFLFAITCNLRFFN
jgi:hypothetical protein